MHDRRRALRDLACAIADGAQVISDFRVVPISGKLVRAGRVGIDGVADAQETARNRQRPTRIVAAVSTVRRHA